MTSRSPSEDPSEPSSNIPPTRAAEEVLDLGLVTASVVSVAITYGLIAWVELNSLFAVISIVSADVFFVFLGVPHLIARWLNYDVDTLLRR